MSDFDTAAALADEQIAALRAERDALAARLADLLKFLDGQPKDLESWFTAQGSSPDTCGLTAEARAYEKGWAEGAMQAYGYILDRIRAADSAPAAPRARACPVCGALKGELHRSPCPI